MEKFIKTNLVATLGNLIYAIGINIFITPLNLYSGGIYGFCQLFRTLLEKFIKFDNIDIAGILYFIVNIPLLIIAYKIINKNFFYKTLISVIVCNIFLTFITIKTPLIDDVLASCFIGGVIAGIGAGMTLGAGSSGGGTDIIGIILIKKDSKLSVGQVTSLINLLLYCICAVMFSPEIAIYSIIFSFISSFAMDKMHTQNIKVNALIFTNKYEISKEINEKLRRGSTSWEGKGDFTGNKKYIISTVISKYEEPELKNIVKNLDENAFVIINSNIDTLGYVEKRLDA